MYWSLGKSVLHGEIDNSVKGKITARIWLLGRDEPLELDLKGNCLSDIAGHRIVFRNRHPSEGDDLDIATMQTGIAGEITASKRTRWFSTPKSLGCVSNALYMEWYSDVNGLVVLEGAGFSLVLSPSQWSITDEEEKSQIESNRALLLDWIASEEEDDDLEDDGPMDEFEWERSLKDSDALTERFAQVIEKYLDHPDADRLIAREMGWTWLFESIDTEDEDWQEVEDEDPDMDWQSDEPLKPNPLTEGEDWIKNRDNRITHPLTDRAFRLAMDIWSHCKEKDMLGASRDKDLQDMIFQAQTLSAKLAGALDSLAYETDMEGGFIVACLKRTLPYVNTAVADADNVERKSVLDKTKLDDFRKNLLEIREEILRLMQKYRKMA